MGQIFIERNQPDLAVEIYEGLLIDILSHLTGPSNLLKKLICFSDSYAWKS